MSEAISRRRIYVVYPSLASAVVQVRFVGLILEDWGHRSSGCVSEGATVLHPSMVSRWWLCPVWSMPEWGPWTYPRVQAVRKFGLLLSLESFELIQICPRSLGSCLYFWVSCRMRHRKPFSFRSQFRYLILFFLGLFLPPSVEDGLDLFSDVYRRFRAVDSPAILNA